jgi:short-subunit dehydrogenase
MSNQWAIITGGIGAALFRRLVQRETNINCLAVGRRLSQLEAVQREANSRVETGRAHIVCADIKTPEGISAILSALPKDACVRFLVHNAGVL